MLVTEIRRAIINPYFPLAIIIGLIALFHGLRDYNLPSSDPVYLASLPSFFDNAYDAVMVAQWWGLFALLPPLLATLPFSDTLGRDRASGFLRLVLARSTYRSYFLAKLTAGCLAGGLAVSLSVLFFFGYTNLAFPRGINLDEYESRLVTTLEFLGPFGSLYHNTPDLYILGLVLLCFLGGAVYALFGLSISSVTNNRYLALSTPFLVYFIGHAAVSFLGIYQWSPIKVFLPFTSRNLQWIHILGPLGLICLASTILFWRGSRLHKDK
jgi:hypothetical protein